MYTIACRAHSCHLLGLSQVGHSPREINGSDGTLKRGPLPGLGEIGHSPRGTSGSAGTLDWGPMWSDSQSTCHPQFPLTPPRSHMPAPIHPFTPQTPYHPLMPLDPLGAPNTHMPPIPIWPLSIYTSCQSSNTLLTSPIYS